MKLSEKQIENQCLVYLERIGIFAWKNQTVGIFDPAKKVYRKSFNRFHLNGVSDIVGILPGGRFFAVEVKSKVGRLSDKQKKFLEEINKRGGLGLMVRSLEDLKQDLGEYDRA